MGIESTVAQKTNEAKIREAARMNLIRKSRDYRQDRLVESWMRVPGIKEGFDKLSLTEKRNTALMLDREANHLQSLKESQLADAFGQFTPENMLRLVRLSMPNVIRSKLFTEFAMESAKDSIKYVRPVWSKTFSGKDLNNRHEDFGNDDPWGYNKTGTQFGDDTNYRRAIYETTQEQASTLAQVKGVVAEKVVTFTFDGDQFGADGGKYIDGYLYVFYGKENVPLATQDKATKTILVNTKDFPGIKVTVSGTNNHVVTVTATDVTVADFAVANIKAKGRFDSETDFDGDYLGEVELMMQSCDFTPKATGIGVSWSNLAEINADASFNLSTEETLLGYAAQAIRVALDHRAIRLAYARAKCNPSSYVTEFKADYSNDGTGAKDGYWQNAQTFIGAVHQAGDTIYDDIKRGGVSRMVGGPAAISYMAMLNYYKPTGKAKAAEGCHQFGEVDGIPTFKVPSEIIPTNEILTIWKNEENEGDIAIAFATLVPFFSTGVIQRKNFYKEAGLMTLGDYAVLNPKYLSIIKITGLKQGAGITVKA